MSMTAEKRADAVASAMRTDFKVSMDDKQWACVRALIAEAMLDAQLSGYEAAKNPRPQKPLEPTP